MANRRMISQEVICCDDFLDMPFEAQALFFQLQIKADEYGFVQSPRGVLRMMGVKQEALETLIEAGFIIRFHSGVIVMTHWNRANTRRADRQHEVQFPDEFKQLRTDKLGVYHLLEDGEMERDSNGNPMSSQWEPDVIPSISYSTSISTSPINSINPEDTTPPPASSSSYPRARAREGDRDDDHDDGEEDGLRAFLTGTGFLAGSEDRLLAYRNQLPDDVIRFGIEQAILYNARSAKYCMTILDGYIANKLFTLDKVRQFERVRDRQTPRDDKSTRARFMLGMRDGSYADENDFY